jgi:NAD(P)-dependent dehydrogenase (short-subunit alcohol dehydrogenase family)
MDRLAGKVALVTGAGSGIGHAATLRFAEAGAEVVAVDVDVDAAEATAKAVVAAGGRAIGVGADVADDRQVRAAVQAAVDSFGRLSVLYNNAGVNSRGSVVDATEEDWHRCLAVNLTGTFLCSRAAVPEMLSSGGGAIVNQASVAGLVGIPGFAAYCAAKGAVIALTRSMSVDLAPRGIRVNAIAPGTVRTPLMEPLLTARGGGDLDRGLALTVAKYPLGRLGTPEEIAAVALFLASDEAAFMTGSIVTADGGMSSQ